MDIITFLANSPNLFILLIALLSLLVGSFLNVVVYRLPRMIEHEWSEECREYLGLKSTTPELSPVNLALPPSHCTHCKKNLKLWHNIPILSYLVLQGKCAYCRAKISLRYPLIELLCCVASVYLAWLFGPTWQTAGALAFTWILIALTFIDIDCHLLPDQLTYLLIGLGLYLSLENLFCDSHDAIIGAIAGYLIFAITAWLFELVTGKIGMGQGDYKLLAGLGAFLGWQMIPLIILLASCSGMICGLTHMALKKQFKSEPLPFGPYLALAGWISLIWGTEILHLYLHMLQ